MLAYKSYSMTQDMKIYSRPKSKESSSCFHGEIYYEGTNKVRYIVFSCIIMYFIFSKCYTVSKTRKEFRAAKEYCNNEGGELVSIPDEKTKNFLAELNPEGGWIGLSREEESPTGAWVWADGSTFEYSNWYKGEPSGDGVFVHSSVGHGWNHRWNDQSGTSKTLVICQFRLD